MKKEYTKEGLKTMHPSGKITIITIDQLRRRRACVHRDKGILENEIKRIDEEIKKLEGLSSG